MCKQKMSVFNSLPAGKINNIVFTQVSVGIFEINFPNERNFFMKSHEGVKREKPKPQFNLRNYF